MPYRLILLPDSMSYIVCLVKTDIAFVISAVSGYASGMPSDTRIGTTLVLSYGSRDLPYDGHDRYRSAQSRSIARCVIHPVVVQLLFDAWSGRTPQHGPYDATELSRGASGSGGHGKPRPIVDQVVGGCHSDFNVTVNEGVMAAGFTGNCCICVQSSRFLRLASTAAVQSSNAASSRSASIRAASAWNAGKSPTDDAKSARTPTNAFRYAAHASHTSVPPAARPPG